MKVITKAVLDMETLRWEYVEAHDEDCRPALCKGDDTAKAAEKQQMQFNQQLMGIFSKQFERQMEIFNFLKGKLEPMIDHPTGFGEDALAAMRTSATENITAQSDNAQRALQNQQFALGGRDLPSGVNEMQFGALKAMEAGKIADSQNQITLANEQLKQQNYWNAMNALNGQEAMLNPLGYANAATQGSNAVANLSQAVTASQQSGLMGMLGGAVGGIFSGAGSAGGFGKLFCWVAEALYGEAGALMVRRYLIDRALTEWRVAAFLVLYAIVGRPCAWLVRKYDCARKVAAGIFDPILEAACGSQS